MDGLHHLQAAGPLQPLPQGGLERLPLFSGGHGRFGVEDGVQKLLVQLVRLAGVGESIVDIGRPVVKGREQEAQLRRGDDLTGGAVVELIFARAVAQLQFAVLHRAHTAHNVGEHRVALIRAILAVFASVGHIVGVVGQQDQIIALSHVQAVDDRLIEFLPHLAVLQPGVPQSHEAAVLIAVRHLLGGEHDVDEVPAQGPGQGLFQQG